MEELVIDFSWIDSVSTLGGTEAATSVGAGSTHFSVEPSDFHFFQLQFVAQDRDLILQGLSGLCFSQ